MTDHTCNIFCQFFKVPTTYIECDDAEKKRIRDTPLFLSISTASDTSEHDRGVCDQISSICYHYLHDNCSHAKTMTSTMKSDPWL